MHSECSTSISISLENPSAFQSTHQSQEVTTTQLSNCLEKEKQYVTDENYPSQQHQENDIPQQQEQEDSELEREVLTEIQQIDSQEIQDEDFSPTLKIKKVRVNRTDSIERRIFKWLDQQGVFQVDPSSKRESFYDSKRAKIVSLKLPNQNEFRLQQLALCRIGNSDLFARRHKTSTDSENQQRSVKLNVGSDSNHKIEKESQNNSSDTRIFQLKHKNKEIRSTLIKMKEVHDETQFQEQLENLELKQVSRTTSIGEYLTIENESKQSIDVNFKVSLQVEEKSNPNLNFCTKKCALALNYSDSQSSIDTLSEDTALENSQEVMNEI